MVCETLLLFKYKWIFVTLSFVKLADDQHGLIFCIYVLMYNWMLVRAGSRKGTYPFYKLNILEDDTTKKAGTLRVQKSLIGQNSFYTHLRLT